MTKRDYQILQKIAKHQRELKSMITEFKIKSHDDLSKIHPAIRRGLVGFIGDIFELTRPLSDLTQVKLPFNNTTIKAFRNAASHRYETISNVMVYACLTHCTDKNIAKAIQDLIAEGFDGEAN